MSKAYSYVYFSVGFFLSMVTSHLLTLKVLVASIDAQWEGMGDVGPARYDHKGFKLQ